MMTLYMAGGMAVASIGLVIYSLFPKKESDDNVIRRRMRGQTSKAEAIDLRQPTRDSVTRRVMKKVAPIAMRPVMLSNPEEMSKLRRRLAAAGFRQDNATTMLLASKTVLALLLALMGMGFAFLKGWPINHTLGIATCGAGVGFLAPNLWLGIAVKKRSEKIRHGLPDVLDLMVICVESGLGLDGALLRVSEEMRSVHPDLSEEMTIVTLESQMGIPRSEALQNLVSRSEVGELKALVAMINQAERFGTSISKALRNQSDTLRTKRRQEAEERAQKTTVKLMAPLILFIFPAILVVLGGPAGLKMIDGLKDSGIAH